MVRCCVSGNGMQETEMAADKVMKMEAVEVFILGLCKSCKEEYVEDEDNIQEFSTSKSIEGLKISA